MLTSFPGPSLLGTLPEKGQEGLLSQFTPEFPRPNCLVSYNQSTCVPGNKGVRVQGNHVSGERWNLWLLTLDRGPNLETQVDLFLDRKNLQGSSYKGKQGVRGLCENAKASGARALWKVLPGMMGD